MSEFLRAIWLIATSDSSSYCDKLTALTTCKTCISHPSHTCHGECLLADGDMISDSVALSVVIDAENPSAASSSVLISVQLTGLGRSWIWMNHWPTIGGPVRLRSRYLPTISYWFQLAVIRVWNSVQGEGAFFNATPTILNATGLQGIRTSNTISRLTGTHSPVYCISTLFGLKHSNFRIPAASTPNRSICSASSSSLLNIRSWAVEFIYSCVARETLCLVRLGSSYG